MIIIIDGYNFLKFVTGTKFVSDSVIHDWMKRFAEYQRLRNNTIIVVFDAGPGVYQLTEWFGAVQVMYAGQYQSADDAIKNWLLKNRGKDILVVSSDQEIRHYAASLDIVSVGSTEFFGLFQAAMASNQSFLSVDNVSIYKTKQSDEYDDVLDVLMESGSRNLVSESLKNEYDEPIRGRGSNKASKIDRSVMQKINKI